MNSVVQFKFMIGLVLGSFTWVYSERELLYLIIRPYGKIRPSGFLIIRHYGQKFGLPVFQLFSIPDSA